jgi:hypothetical protein
MPAMRPAVLTEMVLIVTAEVLILYCLSRILFVLGLQSVAGRGRGGGWWVRWLRLPGNFVHELSHALGYVLFGFRVKRFEVTVTDPKGRGLCQPGKPWSPLASPWLATAAAALAPMLVGVLFLDGLAVLLGIDIVRAGNGLEAGALGFLVGTVRKTLLALDRDSWRTYLFLYLGFSIGAEMAPSDTDFRRSLVPVALVSLLVVGITLYLGLGHPSSPAWEWYSTVTVQALRWLFSVLALAVVATAIVAALVFLPGLVWRLLRRSFDAKPSRRR